MKVKTITLVLAMLTVSVGLWAQKDPVIGTWKLNLAKSKYSPGPAPKSGTTKLEPYGKNGVKLTADGADAKGNPTHVEYSAEADGKDYPLKGSPDADAVSLKRIDPYTVEATNKKGGKVMTTNRWVFSKDGKTRTLTTKGTNARGQAVNTVAVYDRQ